MNKLSLAAILLVLCVSLSSCEAIAGIFKAGVWVGVIGVGIVAFLIIWLIGRSKK